MKKDISFVTENFLCFSCGACSAVCPTSCIFFSFTNSGRLIPKIDYNKCINCGVCFNVCPGIDEKLGINDSFSFEGNVINSYLGRSLNKKIFENSQSGGMVTEVLSYLFDEKLIKYALVVRMDYSNFPTPKYFLTKNKEELYYSQKSIYLPVNILEAFKDIKKLDGDIAVVGVGCQIEGLKSLEKLKPKIYKKIKYRLGLICDGVFSCLSNEIYKTNKMSYKIIYKDKHNPNYINANTVLKMRNGSIKIVNRDIRFLLKNVAKLSRCYICYNKMNVHADFVFGDPWGIDDYDRERGDSIVITRNLEADKIIQNIIRNKRAKLKKISYSDILKGQFIEDRKYRTLQSVAIYKKLGLEIPSYYRNINLPKEIDKNLKREIKSIIDMEKNPLWTNVVKVKFYVYSRYGIIRLKKIIKKSIGRK